MKATRTHTHAQPFPYKRPEKLLSPGSTNAKLAKGDAFGWSSWILYLSPFTQNSQGKNLCPYASAGCASLCPYTAGRGAFSNVEKARRNKTEYFLHDRILFLDQLMRELNHINKLPGNQCVRLNGTSDLNWFALFRSAGFGDPLEMFPNITFYDYTKSIQILRKYAGTRYHLTFSRSENNDLECLQALQLGYNVAKVYFEIPPYDEHGREVVNGDESDLRFLDPSGVIVGLKAKGKARKAAPGFVLA